MLIATWSGSLLAWERKLAVFKSLLSSAFGRAGLWRAASAFIDGLLSGMAHKTGWQLDEQAGLVWAYRLQYPLGLNVPQLPLPAPPRLPQ